MWFGEHAIGTDRLFKNLNSKIKIVRGWRPRCIPKEFPCFNFNIFSRNFALYKSRSRVSLIIKAGAAQISKLVRRFYIRARARDVIETKEIRASFRQIVSSPFMMRAISLALKGAAVNASGALCPRLCCGAFQSGASPRPLYAQTNQQGQK